MKMNKGFTLIELLVVVAIIGILASVVLASLNSARSKGADAAVKANMANIRAQAELFYDDTVANGGGGGRYSAAATTTCSAAGSMFANTNITQAIAQITTQSVAPACYTSADGQKWAMSVSALKGGGTWCVDNSGWVKPGTAAAAGTCG